MTPATASVVRLMTSLPATHQRAFQVAAVIGTVFSLIDLAAVLGQPVGRVLAQLQEVLEAGIVVPDNGTMAFSDPTIREAVYLLVPSAIRLALHRQIGQVLVDRGGSSAAAAGHLVRSAQVGDREALRSLDAAIGEVLASDPAAAVELAIRALDLSELADGERLQRGYAAATALWSAGRAREAVDLAESLIRGPGRDVRSRAGLRLIIGMAAFLDARPDAAIDTVAPILVTAGLKDEIYGEAQLIHLLSEVVGERLEAARLRAETILAGGDRKGGDGALPGALAGLAYVEWAEGRVSSATGLLRAAIKRGERSPAGRSLLGQLGLVAVLPSIGAHDEAKVALEGARRTLESSHQAAWTPALAALAARMHAFRGDMPEARVEATAALAAGAEQGLSLFNATARFVLACVLIPDGDVAGAEREVAAIRAERAAGRAILGRPSHLYLEARLRDAQSGPSAALGLLAPVLADPAAHRRLFADIYGSGPWLVRATLAAGRRDAATAVAGANHWLAIVNPGVSVLAAGASQAEGLLDGDADRVLRAAEDLRLPWARASAEEDAGRLMLEDDPVRGVEHFERALDGYLRSGSQRDVSRVRSRLRQRGLRAGTRGSRRVATTGWDSLSDSELRVATAVGSGLTNAKAAVRLSLSHHTIDSHLRQVFGKLGIDTRAELVRLVVERGNAGKADGGDRPDSGHSPVPDPALPA